MNILAIETSADETAVAITSERKVLSNVIYSQIVLHNKWGGIYPSLAKRAHEERIDGVIHEALKKFSSYVILGNPTNSRVTPESLFKKNYDSGQARMTTAMEKIDFIAVTQGPGLAIALEVGIRKAKELAQKYKKKIITVNHLEGHIYSGFVQNSKGNPKRDFKFPYLAIIISGGHTEIVVWKNHIDFEVIGETLDDAAGEALDKAAKMLGLGYPGGPAIERLAAEVNNKDFYNFPRPMIKSPDLDFSFSGLKTSLFYFLKRTDDDVKIKKIRELASSFQEAVFETILIKTERAIKKTGIKNLVIGGGVIANLYLRKRLRALVKKYQGEIYFPTYKYLTGDNAAMIGVAAYYKAQKDIFAKDLSFDRIPRFQLGQEV